MEVINNQDIELQCLEAEQPIGKMYIAIMDSDILEFISLTDVRRLRENREIEEYTGIQRKLNSTREKEIGKYVNLVDATFPNSIILSMKSENVSYDKNSKKLKIKYKQDVAKILDGQHRIAGLNHFNKKGNKFQCIVTIYIDMELEDQGIVFATINTEQKPVSKSLASDLYSFAKSRSPQKTCHTIARVLDREEKSPFLGKIKILGNANDTEKETITQSTFTKGIMQFISRDPHSDRNIYKENKIFSFNNKPDYAKEKDINRLILRKMFIDDETDIKITQLIVNYFHAVQVKWPYSWNTVIKDNILNKSTGYIALIRFFRNVVIHLRKDEMDIVSKKDFNSFFSEIDIEDKTFTNIKYLPGGKGQATLFKLLMQKSKLDEKLKKSEIKKK